MATRKTRRRPSAGQEIVSRARQSGGGPEVAIGHLANCLEHVLRTLPGGGAGGLAVAQQEIELARRALRATAGAGG